MYRTVWSIWRSLLEETDKLAKAKLAAVEIFQQQIAEDAKHVRQNKLHIAKKVKQQLVSVLLFNYLVDHVCILYNTVHATAATG